MRLKGRTILLVEDNFLVGEDTARLLSDEGGSVIGPVASLAEAIDIASGTRRIDVAVLDVELGRASVYPVAAILRRNTIPFVFFSACVRGMLHPDYRAEPLITKPFLSDDLVRELADEIALRWV